MTGSVALGGRPGEAAHDLLRTGRIRVLGVMPRASNHTFLAEVLAGGRETHAVYKPQAGETPLWDFPDGTLWRREVAAYELAAALGWPAIPPTIARRDGPFGPGSLQAFVEHDPDETFFSLRDQRLDDFRAVAAFDVVANNADRKAGHCLLAPDGTIWMVDHGVCFSPEPKLRTVIWDFADDPVPVDLLDSLRRVAKALRAGPLGTRMRDLLSGGEVDAMIRRSYELVAGARFPQPGPGRPFPWPPV